MRDTYAVCCGRDEYSHMRYTAGFLMRRGETGGRSGDCVGVDLPIFEGTMRRAREGDEGRDGFSHMRYTYAVVMDIRIDGYSHR